MQCRLLAWGGFVVAAWVTGCGEPPNSAPPYAGPPLSSPAVVLLNNLQVSGLGRIEVDGQMKEVPDIALGADPTLASSHEKYFALVRDQQLVREFDPVTLAFTRQFVPYADAELSETKVLSCKTEVKGINPQDVAVDGDGRLWVARFERPTLAIVEADGSFSGTVDLSAYADADGFPEMSAVHVVGNRVYVALERLDRCGGWLAAGPGRIVVIDVATRNIVSSIELGGANPFGRLNPVLWDSSGNTVSVALPGDSRSIDAGDAAAIVDLEAGMVQGFGRETELGGSVMEVVAVAPDESYVIVAGADDPLATPTSVVRMDPKTGKVVSTLVDSRLSASGGGYYHRGLTVVGDHVLVGSQAPNEKGVLVFDRKSGQRVGMIPSAKLPPIAIEAAP